MENLSVLIYDYIILHRLMFMKILLLSTQIKNDHTRSMHVIGLVLNGHGFLSMDSPPASPEGGGRSFSKVFLIHYCNQISKLWKIEESAEAMK
jgi:hypothetical protein